VRRVIANGVVWAHSDRPVRMMPQNYHIERGELFRGRNVDDEMVDFPGADQRVMP
jgi:hypothetical protein